MSTLNGKAEAELKSSGSVPQHKPVAIFSVLAAMALVVLDSSSVNVALPTIARSLHVLPDKAVAVVTAYQLGLVIALLPIATLGESLGYRRVFKIGVALFTAASIGCSLAPSLPLMVAARFLQGLGGAAVMALGVALLRQIVAPSQLGAAIGWNALTVALSSVAGPAIGALIVSISSWQWLFAATQPVAIAVLVTSRALPDVAGSGRRIDIVSVFLNALFFGMLVAACHVLPSHPGLSVTLVAFTAAALLLLIHKEARQEAPLIPLDLLRSSSFRISIAASICCFVGQSAGMIALPFYFQHSFHQSVLMTSVLIAPWPLMAAIFAPLAGRAADRFSTAMLCALGGIFLAIGLVGAALWEVTDPIRLIPFVVFCGIGVGLFQVSNNRNIFMSAPPERSGAAGGMQSTARLTGQTLGAVMVTLLFASQPLESVPRIAMTIGAMLTLMAGAISTLRSSK